MADLDLHHEDQKRLQRRRPGFCHFFPEYMAKGVCVKLLQGNTAPMEDSFLQAWKERLENVADHATLFFVELVRVELKIGLKGHLCDADARTQTGESNPDGIDR